MSHLLSRRRRISVNMAFQLHINVPWSTALHVASSMEQLAGSAKLIRSDSTRPNRDLWMRAVDRWHGGATICDGPRRLRDHDDDGPCKRARNGVYTYSRLSCSGTVDTDPTCPLSNSWVERKSERSGPKINERGVIAVSERAKYGGAGVDREVAERTCERGL